MTSFTDNADWIHTMIDRGCGRVHMVGVCGIGMAGVAYLLRQRGFSVSGCDVALNRQADWLEACGISVSAPHATSHIDASVDWVVRSTAVPVDSEEIRAARELGIPVSRRGEVLPALLAGLDSVAVAGTHGKTTTATLIAQLLKGAGHDAGWCIGGESCTLGAVAGGGMAPTIIVEADESDGTLVNYHPDIAVITNVDFDHMEHFASERDFEACFETLVAQTRRCVLYCADDPRAARLCTALPNARGYGFGEASDLQGTLHERDGQMALTLHAGGIEIGTVGLPVPGDHNALNALAGIGVCLELGVSFDAIAAAMDHVCLPKRRFEVISRAGGITVVSDYAHHPAEIAALVQTAKQQHSGRLLAVFQPHRYTRTRALGPAFPKAFEGVDCLVLAPVYPASEQPLAGGRACDLYAKFRAGEGAATVGANLRPMLATSLEQAWGYLQGELTEGDMLLVIGAGDVERVAHWAGESSGRSLSVAGLKDALSEVSMVRQNEPLGNKTTYGIGGKADIWVEIGSIADLSATLRWCDREQEPFCIVGAGSNVLVSDLGVRGVVARLTGDVFKAIRHDGDEIVVGGAVSLARLMEWTTQESLTGLEFLEGVPGGVGGIVRMNGGAYGHEICERISWIRGLNYDGSECTVPASALEWGYRGCKSLDFTVVVEIGLRLNAGNRAEIESERDRISERRRWMRGLRCSGSVFRNPEGQSAGRAVEALGLKGRRVGGAQVLPRHGNFIVAERDAMASDVLALIQQVQAAVETETGVALKREVVFLG